MNICQLRAELTRRFKEEEDEELLAQFNLKMSVEEFKAQKNELYSQFMKPLVTEISGPGAIFSVLFPKTNVFFPRNLDCDTVPLNNLKSIRYLADVWDDRTLSFNKYNSLVF